MREFRPTPPTGGSEPEDPWAYRPQLSHGSAAPSSPTGGLPDDRSGMETGPAAGPAPWGAPAAYNHPRGTTVLVLGILSVVMLPLLGPFAWAMGHSALKEVDRSGVPAANRSMLVGGMVTGIVGTVFLVLGTLVFLAFMGLFITSVSTTTG
ncbi:DUF4190 domain-containing protein [Ornithinimicrobium sp. W1665]|uniref:DUF4190 domain-containing protein n=1 Tax=Ornithinimicrobium sp. W1665 TaxID=3416666 RepID=UPI003CE855C3